MTDFTGLRIGKAGTPEDSTNRPSQDNNVLGVTAYPARQGVPTTQIYTQSLVPLTKNASNIAAAQTPAAAGNLTLAAGTGSTAATVHGNSVIALDCARCITITGFSGTVSANFTITGYDRYQNLMTQLIAGPTGATSVTTTKAFAYIQSIAVSAGTTANVEVGTSDVIGLDMYASAYELIDFFYAGADITANTGFTAGDATSPATSSTGDVRGTYALQSASNGTNRLTVNFFLLNTDTVTQVWGQPQA